MQGVEARYCLPITVSGFRSRIVCAVAAFAVALACIAQDGKVSAGAATASAQAANAANDKTEKVATPASERKKQIADESAQLLTMALALKAEVDKTTKDTLSLDVIRKAEQIERLAKSVKEKMK
jgi:hypothetical protein